jgi:hypothetical protein
MSAMFVVERNEQPLVSNNENAPTRHSEAAQKIERLAYTKEELCASLSLSPVTLWRLEKRGLIHSVAGIRHKLYSVAEVKRFLARREEP